MTVQGVRIENLAAFRADLRRSIGATPVELTKALKAAGAPIVQEAGALAPHRTGALAGSYKALVRGTSGRIESGVPYGPGAEWGLNGKWSGFQKYGSRGERFAGRAVETKADEVLELIERGLKQVAEIYGWAHG